MAVERAETYQEDDFRFLNCLMTPLNLNWNKKNKNEKCKIIIRNLMKLIEKKMKWCLRRRNSLLCQIKINCIILQLIAFSFSFRAKPW